MPGIGHATLKTSLIQCNIKVREVFMNTSGVGYAPEQSGNEMLMMLLLLMMMHPGGLGGDNMMLLLLVMMMMSGGGRMF